MTGYREFFNPATGERIQYTATAETTNGELVRFDWHSVSEGNAGAPKNLLQIGATFWHFRWDTSIDYSPAATTEATRR